MFKKLVVLALVAVFCAMVFVPNAQAGEPRKAKFVNTYRWVNQFLNAYKYRFMYVIGIPPADGPTDGGYGPGDGTGYDGDGPEDGTGYGPGCVNYRYQKYGERLCHRYGSQSYMYQNRGE